MRALFIIVVLAILAAAALFGALTWADRTASSGSGGGRPPTPIIVAPVGEGVFADRLEALGTARANESVEITAKVTETVSRVAFEDGDPVERGQILVELTDEEEGADLAEARASLLEAQQQLDRISGLVTRGNATRSSLDTATSSRDQARARVRAIEARLADRLIRAPFSGVLGLRQVSPGTLVSPGTVITTLDDVNPIKLDFAIPETFYAAVSVGLPVSALADAYTGETFTGTVSVIDTRIDPVTRSVLVRSELPNDDLRLRPGMLMRVEVTKNERTALMVVESAIVPVDTRTFVLRVKDETVERVQVEIGARKPGFVEILSGVEAGDLVVAAGTNRVRAGAPVRIVETRQIDGE